MKLTLARINSARIPPDKAELKLWDAAVNGLYLRLLAGGGRSWVYRYRASGGGRSAKVRSIKLGSFPALTIDAARDAARAHAAAVAKGQDPAQVRQEKRRKERATLGSLLAIGGPYEASLTARHVVKRKEVLSSLRRGLVRLMDVDIAQVSRRDFVEVFDELKDLPGAREDLRKNTRSLLEWTTNNGLTAHNPLAGMRLPPKTRVQRIQQTLRRRALDDPAIVAVWKAADTSGRFGSLVQFALLTGMRKNELATLRWDSIHTDRIVLPAALTKTGAIHEIPLTPLMGIILKRQPRTTSPYVFPSDITGGPMMSWNRWKMALMRDASAGDWTLHDLRRSCRSLMTRLMVPEATAELAIGHVKSTLVGLYDLEKQWDGRVDAFQRVSDHIERLVAATA